LEDFRGESETVFCLWGGLGDGDLEALSALGFSFLVSAAGGGGAAAAAAGFFSLSFPEPLAPRPREEEEEEERDRELDPEELEELEEEEREPFEEPLEEEPLLESLLPPRFFFLSAAEASFALVRSRLLRLDAILKMGEQRRPSLCPSLCLLVDRNQFFLIELKFQLFKQIETTQL